MKVEITSRYSGEVRFTHEVPAGTSTGAALALAVLAAVSSGAYLSRADLSGADLSGANLSGAYLSRADLSGADLSGAYLSRADLSGADLSGAYLSRANLSRADLSGADLSGANLSGANLSGADLSGADLSGAYLSRADLSGADLSEADLSGANLPAFQIPQEGTLTVFKAVQGGVCKLLIPEDAARTATMIGRKCRAEYVVVLEAPEDGRGLHDSSVVYRVGETVRPDSYNPSTVVECTHGIHFFQTREEAEAYR